MLAIATRATILAVLALAAVCVCATARMSNGWCAVHGHGYVGGLEITSPWLYETADAHGHDVDLSTFVCPSCRRAIASDGFCEADRIGFVDGKAYFSLLTYELARGTPRAPSEIPCRVCRKNSETHGWCGRCKVGMAGPYTIRDRAAYDRTVHALAIFEIANAAAARCAYCAAALVTDTECPICKIQYRDGRAIAH